MVARRLPCCLTAVVLSLGTVTGLSAVSGPSHRVHAAAAQTSSSSDTERDFLTRIRRVTIDGLRAGEGYFSPDGTRMVFQSEREPGNPFYQIYTLDLTTGESQRVSPGHGKTTCAFFHPRALDVLFSSTHHDPRSRDLQQAELDFRASGQQRRYGWDYIVDTASTKEPVQVTHTPGFDGLPVPRPDGRALSWTSSRGGGGAQIYMAQWNHETARAALARAPERVAHSLRTRSR